MQQRVTTRISPVDLQALLRDLPGILSGRLPDRHGIARAVQGAMSKVLLARVKASYLVKSRGGSDETGRWAPLKPATLARKRRRGQPSAILIGRGDIYRGLKVLESRPGRFSIGSDAPHAEIHQKGSSRRNIPPRPFIPEEIPERWWDELLTVANDTLVKVLAEVVARGRV